MQCEYLLGVDGGGSKTTARLLHQPSGRSWEGRAAASSLSLGLTRSVAVILELARELAFRAQCDLNQMAVVCGLAGAGEVSLANQAHEAMASHFAQLQIMTDARTSAYGANAGKPVAVVALGTGSVAMMLDEQGQETMIGGWGLLVGDEGGGARLGVNAINAMLWELDTRGKAESDLGRWLCSQLGTTRSAILYWLRHATATQYAGLVPGIVERMETCALAKTLFKAHMQAVERLICATGEQLPVVLTGGLADISAKHLHATLKTRVIPARGNALDGACILAEKLMQTSLPAMSKGESE
ncbi:BadF/BadG/BcrA/BcrD ATPase family protein [Lacimicrobium sp. SS2-24]|uniref:BadF/BadG/BcrA/BcrD ATPase family protein n=1 Tax=Lacimicrobium sp. SS2-24 TaxID=2005569 RepID=UPI000B4BED8B|nr:BadF/BadG/BcrA/BcrD ATPase family protein [Lacimicrobium sp. SS2-24]